VLTGPVSAHVITVSNRSAAGVRDDTSGALAEALLAGAGYVVTRALVPDGAESVRAALESALASGARFVMTTGGTGVTPTDRTPEGTLGILDRELPGFAELLRAEAVKKTPFGALTRGLVGVTDSSPGRPGALIVNLPGKPAAVEEGLAVLLPLIPHILDRGRPLVRGGTR
jgi:molybdenum cofactor synthesis domain-containing protein